MANREAPADQACAYCGSREYRVVVSYPQGTAVRCSSCRLVRTFPYPTFEYTDNREYAMGYTGRERLFERFALEFMDFVKRYAPGRELLEVGSGMGFLLDEAVRRGYSVRGLEVNRWEVEALCRRGLDVRASTLEDAGLPDQSFDVVCMSHVLEHVPNLRQFLTEVRRVLRPGGILAVSQPHYNAPLPRILRHLWYGWQWQQHLWHFDVPTLSRVLSTQGLEPVGVAYNSLHHAWLPDPMSSSLKVLAVQIGSALLARSEVLLGEGDQFFLAAKRTPAE